MRHPEAQSNEVFFTNASPTQFEAIDFKTKRPGTTAFDGEGNQLHHANWFPVFISKTELHARNVPLTQLRRAHRGTVEAKIP